MTIREKYSISKPISHIKATKARISANKMEKKEKEKEERKEDRKERREEERREGQISSPWKKKKKSLLKGIPDGQICQIWYHYTGTTALVYTDVTDVGADG